MKPNWQRTLSEVLKHETKSIVLTSENTGNEYTTDVIPKLKLLSTGSLEEVNGKYKYSVVDTINDLEYNIKTTNKVDIRFSNVRGGSTSNGVGWYAADSVAVVQRNA